MLTSPLNSKKKSVPARAKENATTRFRAITRVLNSGWQRKKTRRRILISGILALLFLLILTMFFTSATAGSIAKSAVLSPEELAEIRELKEPPLQFTMVDKDLLDEKIEQEKPEMQGRVSRQSRDEKIDPLLPKTGSSDDDTFGDAFKRGEVSPVDRGTPGNPNPPSAETPEEPVQENPNEMSTPTEAVKPSEPTPPVPPTPPTSPTPNTAEKNSPPEQPTETAKSNSETPPIAENPPEPPVPSPTPKAEPVETNPPSMPKEPNLTAENKSPTPTEIFADKNATDDQESYLPRPPTATPEETNKTNKTDETKKIVEAPIKESQPTQQTTEKPAQEIEHPQIAQVPQRAQEPQIPREESTPRRPVPTRQIGGNGGGAPTSGGKIRRRNGGGAVAIGVQSMAVLRSRYGDYFDELLRRINSAILIQQQLSPLMFSTRGVVTMTFTINREGVLDRINMIGFEPSDLTQEIVAARRVLDDVRNGKPLSAPTPEMLADPLFQRITINFLFEPR